MRLRSGVAAENNKETAKGKEKSAKSKVRSAKSKPRSAKCKGRRAKSEERRAKSKEPMAKHLRYYFGLTAISYPYSLHLALAALQSFISLIDFE